MSNDPRGYIKNLLMGVTATLDDNVTAAQIMVVYTGSPENYKQWFYIYDYDAVITIDPPRLRESGAMRRIDYDPLRFEGGIPVHASAVDKTTVTATKLLNKITTSIDSRMTLASVEVYDWNAWVESTSARVIPMGGYDPIWVTDYVIHFKPMRGIN